jgi:hypothetical protein
MIQPNWHRYIPRVDDILVVLSVIYIPRQREKATYPSSSKKVQTKSRD